MTTRRHVYDYGFVSGARYGEGTHWNFGYVCAERPNVTGPEPTLSCRSRVLFISQIEVIASQGSVCVQQTGRGVHLST